MQFPNQTAASSVRAAPSTALADIQVLPKDVLLNVVERMDRNSSVAFLSANVSTRTIFAREVAIYGLEGRIRGVSLPAGHAKKTDFNTVLEELLTQFKPSAVLADEQVELERLLHKLTLSLLDLTPAERKAAIVRMVNEDLKNLPQSMHEPLIQRLGEVLRCRDVADTEHCKELLQKACDELPVDRQLTVRTVWSGRECALKCRAGTGDALQEWRPLLLNIAQQREDAILPLLEMVIRMMGSTVLNGKVQDFISGLKDWTPKQKSQLALVSWTAYGKSLSRSTDPLNSGTTKCNTSASIVEQNFAGLISLVDGLEPADELEFQIQLCALLMANEQRVLTSGCVRKLVERCVQKQAPGQFTVWRDLLELLGRMSEFGASMVRPQDNPESLIKLIARYAEQVGAASDWSAVAVALEFMQHLCGRSNSSIALVVTLMADAEKLLTKLDKGITTKHFEHILQLVCALPAGPVRRNHLLALMHSPAAQERSALVQQGLTKHILNFRAEISNSDDYLLSEDVHSASSILFESATDDQSNSSRANSGAEQSVVSQARVLLDALSNAGFPTPRYAQLARAVMKLRREINWSCGLSDDESDS